MASEFIKAAANEFWSPSEARCVTGAQNNSTLDYSSVEDATIFALACAVLSGFGITKSSPARHRLLADLKSDLRVAISKHCDYECKKFSDVNKQMFTELHGRTRSRAFAALFKKMLEEE